MAYFGLFLLACWLGVLLLTIKYERSADRLLKARYEREDKGVLVEVGTTLVLNGEPLHVYKIEGTRLYTTTTKFTERVQ